VWVLQLQPAEPEQPLDLAAVGETGGRLPGREGNGGGGGGHIWRLGMSVTRTRGCISRPGVRGSRARMVKIPSTFTSSDLHRTFTALSARMPEK